MFPGNTIVYGETGEGKSAFCVSEIREYLSKGLRVATNIELDLSHLLPPWSRATYTLLPQLPTFADLDAIGRGSDSKDHNKFGLLVLDEAPSFLDAREWNAAGRKSMVEWCRHARKRGWRLVFLSQSPDLIDKQVRKSSFPLVAQCRRLDHVKVPFLPLRLPHVHLAVFRYGRGQSPLIVKRKLYLVGSVQKAYDTNQEFFEVNTGVREMPSAWDLKGSKMRKWDMYKSAVFGSLFAGLFLGAVVAFPVGSAWRQSAIAAANPEAVNKPKYDASVSVLGYVLDGPYPQVILSDGRMVRAKQVRQDLTGMYFQIDSVWVGVKK